MAKLRIDLEEMDLDTLAVIESVAQGHALGIAEMRTIVAGLLVGDDDLPLPVEEAMKLAGKYKVREVRAAFDTMGAHFLQTTATAIPKATTPA